MNHPGPTTTSQSPSLGAFDQCIPSISPFLQNFGRSDDSPVYSLSDENASDCNAAFGFHSGFGPPTMFDMSTKDRFINITLTSSAIRTNSMILRSIDEAVFKNWGHLQEREEDTVFMSLSRIKEN
jgi:hypothetical protein